MNSLETAAGGTSLTARTTFIGGVIGCCLTQSPHADDLEWARVHGFTRLIEMKSWPGHPMRAAADVVASALPDNIKERSRRLILRRNYSSSEMHADLLYMFGSPVFFTKPLPPWKKILAEMGPRTWELRGLFEDVSSLVDKTNALEKLLWRDEGVVKAIREVDIVSASIRETMAPFFDHIRCVEAVFVPFILPRSGFGIAPRGEHVIIAFGPGTDSHDHAMTIWHELLHYPVRRVMYEVLKVNHKATATITRDLVVLEENIVAVLTDCLCPVSRERPNMKFDSLIRENLKTARRTGEFLDLKKLIEAVIGEATWKNDS